MADELFLEQMLGQRLLLQLALLLPLPHLTTSPFYRTLLEDQRPKARLHLTRLARLGCAEVANSDKLGPLRGALLFSEDISKSVIGILKHFAVVFLQRSGLRIKFTVKTPPHRRLEIGMRLAQSSP